MSDHFNGLTPAQAEALALIAEECGEAIQIIGKILRHGLASHHPNDKTKRSNRSLLEKELGDIRAATVIAASLGVVIPDQVTEWSKQKLRSVGRYLHHVELRWTHPVEDSLVEPCAIAGCRANTSDGGGQLCDGHAAEASP